MAGKKRSGLAAHRRAYAYYPIGQSTTVVPTTYTITYNGNTNTSGNAPTDGSPPYASGSSVTVLGNSGYPVLANSGFTFAGWNTVANGSGTSYLQGNTFTINTNTTLYAQWTPVIIPPPVVVPPPSAPTLLSGVGGNTEAYILFTQIGNVTNYEYSTDDGVTFLLFDPPQIYSPVNIKTLSSDGETPLTNETTYTVKLKAVKSGESSDESVSVNVTPTITSLLTTNRIIYLDANNESSYSGSGSAWTNLDSGGALSATLNGSPTFDTTTESGNKYFEFNPGALTEQFAQINQAAAINPVLNTPFTIQMWVRINNVGSSGSLVSKVFSSSSYDGYALGYSADTLQLHENGQQKVNYFSTMGTTTSNNITTITGSSFTDVLSSGWALYTANIQFGNGFGRQNNIFVNGRQVMRATSNEVAISSPTQNLTFPKGFYGEGECDIGQFYYYNTELSTTQIIQNFDATKHRYI